GLALFVHADTAARVAFRGPVRTLDDGDVLTLEGPHRMTLRVLHTPGHAPGHLCLFDEASGTLVVGDMVASEGTILIAPASGGGDMAAYLCQLRRLGALDAATALPAHGDPIHGPRAHFERYVAHRLAREERVRQATRAAGDTLDALVRVAYGDTPAALHPIAKLSLEAHLEKLVAEGHVKRDGDVFFSAGSTGGK
ncbi:MAG TPA: MBL fold metallo-hydrolase, partial [Polyangiaceae bacterium]|nr:MBL fold metallo-hydrolase [Polyangiaceae bacterium]